MSAIPNAARNDWLDAPATRRLKDTILWHLDNVADDNELLRRFEPLCNDPVFPALGWFWAPALYGRNKTLFRPFIGQHFSEHYTDLERAALVNIEWDEEVAASLEPWLAILEQDGEIALFRRLYAWQRRTATGAIDASAWRRDLTRRFASAATVTERTHVLQRFALRAELDEASAIELYDKDAALAAPFILEHLPQQRNDDQRELWSFLADRARGARDEIFYFELYRRQADLETWARDTLELCRLQNTPAELRAALEQRHPRGRFAALGEHFRQLLDARGVDVLEYVQHHLHDAFGLDAQSDDAERSGRELLALAELAESNHWLELWAAVFVVCSTTAQYNEAIARVLEGSRYNEIERELRLSLLSGTAREWSDLGGRAPRLLPLDQENALTLYEKHPALLRTVFRDHLQPRAELHYFELFEVAWSQEDPELTDFLASRYATQLQDVERGDAEQQLHGISQMVAERYRALTLTAAELARRAARILTLIPAHAIRNHRRLLEENALARFLFEVRLRSYLEAPDAIRDLLEAGDLHVRELAYRVLGLPDARAEEHARHCVDLLIGCFLEPLRRSTRVLAMAALDRAATTQENAVRILGRARELASVSHRPSSTESLIGLIARILVRFPTLAGADERQVAYAGKRRNTTAPLSTPTATP